MMVDKSYYNTVLSQTVSPCGNYLLAGNVFGDIALFDIKDNVHGSFENELPNHQAICQKAKFNFKIQNELQVCSMTSTDSFLIIGTMGEIIGWDWKSVCSGNPKTCWTIQVPVSKINQGERMEVNYLLTTSRDNDHCGPGGWLYAGCGDNNVYVFSLEDGKCIRTYEGHTDYIHSIALLGSQLVSGSEDGSVKLWDSRKPTITDNIYPYKDDKINRPAIGRWIGDVSINEDWLLCGGGARLSLWNLRTMNNPMTIFSSTNDEGIHVATFSQDGILAGGCAPYFSQLTYSDKLNTSFQVSSKTVYSCYYQYQPFTLLTLAGCSNEIDICLNLSYRDSTLNFY